MIVYALYVMIVGRNEQVFASHPKLDTFYECICGFGPDERSETFGSSVGAYAVRLWASRTGPKY